MRAAVFIALLIAAVTLSAQEDHGLTPADIQRGGQIYLTNCASCHGPDGDGIAGVNLASSRFRRAQSDRDLIQIVRNGIPGTPMPPGNFSEAQAGIVVAYLHSMGSMPRTTLKAANPGDPDRGRAVVEGKGQCLTCHRIADRGGFLGPDLSEIGGTRRASDIERSLIDPNAEIRQDNRTVRAVSQDGTAVTGNLLNQDTFSVQILDATGKLMSLEKNKLRQFEIMTLSPMPAYRGKLSDQELADAVSYLAALKGMRP